VRRAMSILKPGGAAIFFEPMEGGNAILRIICQDIAAEARRRNVKNRTLQWLAEIPAQLEPQIVREGWPGWRSLNDKWAFPRSMLAQLAKDAGARLEIFPLHDNQRQFRRQISYMLTTYGQMQETDLPDWAWEIVRRFDEDAFSPEMRTDLAIEACIAFVRER